VDIIAGASLARRRVNLPLSIVKTGTGYRAGLSSPDSGAVSKKRCPSGGTVGSNPPPSSAESVSAVGSSAVGREPRGFAALCAYAGT